MRLAPLLSCVAAVCVLTPGVVYGSPQDPLPMQSLTVPASLLPEGCQLKSQGAIVSGPRLATNPWIGTDPDTLAALRASFLPVRLPQDALVTTAEQADMLRRLARDVAEGYVALYEQRWAADLRVSAVRFTSVPERPIDLLAGPEIMQREVGTTWIRFGLDHGACARAIATYLRSLG